VPPGGKIGLERPAYSDPLEKRAVKGGTVGKPNFDYPAILDLFPQHLDPKRSQSASFLIWYLENYYRLDTQAAIDSVCDQRGDRGVDGIFVNDSDETITIFQNTISQKNTAIGDKSLREFAGTLTQFRDAASVKAVSSAVGNNLLAALIRRLDLETKVGTYKLRGEFLSNVDLDGNGKTFLDTTTNLEFIGRSRLSDTYISDSRDIPVHPKATFDIVGFTSAEYTVDANTKALIVPIKATELVNLSGISDQSLFAYNVRGPLGKTGVNKDIVKSIGDAGRHRLFPLFHNGITIIAKKLENKSDEVAVYDYFVVNGCQSLTSFFDNKAKLTDDLRVLTKFVQVEPSSQLAKLITEISNNQNGVKPRDFMANNPFQIKLQNEFRQNYRGQYFFEIKQGEIRDTGDLILNEEAGLLLMAFDKGEPWATHRKYQVFEDKYTELFARPEVTADRIVLLRVIAESIDAALPRLTNGLVAKYVLTRYMLLYCIHDILKKDELWTKINTAPQTFIRNPQDRQHFRNCIDNIVSDLVTDVDAEIEDAGADFDYRGKLRDSEWVKKLSKSVVGDHLKMVARKKIQSFKGDWQTRSAKRQGNS
jgi:AIPR protein